MHLKVWATHDFPWLLSHSRNLQRTNSAQHQSSPPICPGVNGNHPIIWRRIAYSAMFFVETLSIPSARIYSAFGAAVLSNLKLYFSVSLRLNGDRTCPSSRLLTLKDGSAQWMRGMVQT